MKARIERRTLVLKGRRWGARILPMLSRPSWHRYVIDENDHSWECATLRLGVVQVKWTRSWPTPAPTDRSPRDG